MQAIKCPNCGNGEVQQLTDEKYFCVACDNMFTIYDSSKEFRKTDEHISEVHKDLKSAIKSIKQSNMGSNELEHKLKNAFALLDINDYVNAENAFKELRKKYASTYKTWWGSILCFTINLKKDNDSSILFSPEYTKYIENMRKCKDYEFDDLNVEDRICDYVNRIKGIYIDKCNQNIEDIEKKKKELEDKLSAEKEKRDSVEESLRGMKHIEDEVEQKGKVFLRISSVAGILFGIIIVIIGIKIAKWDIDWLMESIEYINQPLAEDDSDGLSKLGKGFIHLIMIVIKPIIGIALEILMLFILYYGSLAVGMCVCALLEKCSGVSEKNKILEAEKNKLKEAMDNILELESSLEKYIVIFNSDKENLTTSIKEAERWSS